MDTFTSAFADELIKVAKYPVSKALTSRTVAGATTALGSHAAMVPAAIAGNPLAQGTLLFTAMAPLIGGVLTGAPGYALHSAGRDSRARALLGKIRRGGKGLSRAEKKHLAEAAELSPEMMAKSLERNKAKAAKKGLSTHLGDRALSSNLIPTNILGRRMNVRGLAGRAADRDWAGMTEEEQKLLSALRGGVRSELSRGAAKKALPYVVGAGAAAGAAKAVSDRRKKKEGGQEKAAQYAGTIGEGRAMVQGWKDQAERAKLKKQTQSAMKGWKDKGYFGQSKTPSSTAPPKPARPPKSKALRPRSAQEALRGSYGS